MLRRLRVALTPGGRFRISGPSMVPYLQEGDVVLVDRVAYSQREPRSDEVILIRRPPERQGYSVKRLAGLPGDRIELTEGTWELGGDEYFVLGDNRLQSTDSRTWGMLGRDDMVGPVIGRLWPPGKRG